MRQWEENEHPRDDDGKFTFKNGGSTGGNVNNKGFDKETKDRFFNTTTREVIEKSYKNELLNILSNEASNADTLYGNIEYLEKKIEKLGGGFKEKLNELKGIKILKTPFSKDTKKHEVLRQLSIYCYDNGSQKIPEGYDRIGHFHGKNNGFDAVVVKNDDKKEVVIAYRGMEPKEDLLTISRIKYKHYSSQQKDAQETYNRIKRDQRFKDYEIYTTGMSLGGYLAQYVAAKNNLKSATFNAHQGTKNTFQKEAKEQKRDIPLYTDNIVNYRNRDDNLSSASTENNLGASLETTTVVRNSKKHPVSHMAENMGDLEKARIIKNYYRTKTERE